MKFLSNKLPLVVLISLSVYSGSGFSETQPPSFIFGLAQEAQTIGDLKPTYLIFEDKGLPKVSIEFVLNRYKKLFDTAKSPTVRIDALNRINNLTAQYGITSEKITIGEVEQSEAVIDAYNRIVEGSVDYGRTDEFLYQTAKALDTIGQELESIKRLEYLIGLYPDSPLYDESVFRIAEGYFKQGEYIKAEALYKKLLSFAKNDDFKDKAQFKLGWSQFQQKRTADASKSAIKMLDYYDPLKGARSIDVLEGENADIAEDTLRLLALIFSRGDGTSDIEALQTATNNRNYTFLLYDSFFRSLLRQKSYAEAAETAEGYSDNYRSQSDSFAMLVRAIRAYRKGELPIEEWRLKEKFVSSYGIKSNFWTVSDANIRSEVREYLQTYLSELGHLNFVRMQQAKDDEEKIDRAIASANFYTELTETSADPKDSGRHLYLAAEAMSVAGRFNEAIKNYELSAYQAPNHADAKEAAYAAIVSYAALQAGKTTELAKRESILKFTDKFYEDKRSPILLAKLSQDYLSEENYQEAIQVAERVVVHDKAKQDELYVSWLSSAHSHFALNNFAKAEQAYSQTLSFNEFIKSSEDRTALRERLAASVYKQAEAAEDPSQAAELFLKVVDVVPETSFGAQAVYDASTAYLKAENWTAAIASMSFFQDAYPQHEFNKDINEKLVFAYINNDEPISAAESLIAIADATDDSQRSMNAIYQAAGLYQEAGFELEHIELLERFTKTYPGAFDLNMEAYQTLAAYYFEKGFDDKGSDWRSNMIEYERNGGSNRSGRSKTIAAKASYEIALEGLDAYEKAKLTLPLKKSLQRKKVLLNALVEKFESAADYGINEYVTASTFQLGQIYKTLSADLLSSERPTGLNELELEQYDILLEEQAYPFEEQAIALFEVNTVKAREGNFDEWIQKSFAVLAQMNPTAYQRESLQTDYAPEYF